MANSNYFNGTRLWQQEKMTNKVEYSKETDKKTREQQM